MVLGRPAAVAIAALGRIVMSECDILPISGIVAIGTVVNMVVGRCRVAEAAIRQEMAVIGLPAHRTVAISARLFPVVWWRRVADGAVDGF